MEHTRQRFRRDDALSAYLRTQCEAVVRGEFALRTEAGVETVHDTRVAVRRLRSTLRTFAPLLEDTPEGIDDDLRWLSGLLSDVRDADVLRDHLDHKLDGLPAELVLGPVRQELTESLDEMRHWALDQWREQRAGDRFLQTLGTVGDWRELPPVAGSPVSGALLRDEGKVILARARRKARRRLRQADDCPIRVHRARKALKRLRYAADVLEPVRPGAARTSRRARKLQHLLGRHQDLVVEVAFLRHQGARLGDQEGHNGFAYGVLMARAEQDAKDIRNSRPRW